ncbi:MAG: helix-turn-helix transcriptional regulator [Ruminococcus sp.]|nr:helix-turn-helix transcriptional regulator [Ruminococcus sp.]
MPLKFSDNLVRYRKKKGLTQGQLAKLLSVTPQAVSKWEKGSYPDSELLPSIAQILDVSLDVLFGLKEESGEVNLAQVIMDEIGNLPEEQRAERVMELFYNMLCSYNRNISPENACLPKQFTKETYAHLRTDYELAVARLNQDMQYFTFLRIPESGINSYFSITPRVMELFKLLSDENALRIICFAETLQRNYILTKECISKRLGIPLETVSEIVDRFDRLGITWKLTADIGDEPFPVYGYVHSIPLTAILTLAASLVNFIACREPDIDIWTKGPFRAPGSDAGSPESDK